MPNMGYPAVVMSHRSRSLLSPCLSNHKSTFWYHPKCNRILYSYGIVPFARVFSYHLGRVHTTALGPERFRNATGRPCSHLFHCVRSFRNEPTTSRCDRSGTVPEPIRLALWCERTTGPVPVATR